MPGSTARRSEVIRAATRAFAQHGYDGSTLSDIAGEAGVSQPRISQIFGTKESAFLEALRVSAEVLLDALEVEAAAEGRSDFSGAFNRLCAREPEALNMVFQGFTTTTVPRVCDESRRILDRFLDLVVTRAGCSYDDALLLLGRGFVIHHLLAADLPGHSAESRHFTAMLDVLDPHWAEVPCPRAGDDGAERGGSGRS